MVVEIEVLCGDGWRESRHRLTRSSPQTGDHVDGEGEGAEAEHDGGHRHGFLQVSADSVLLELQPAHEISAEGTEDDDPQGEEHLTVQDVPAVGEVSHGEELQ